MLRGSAQIPEGCGGSSGLGTTLMNENKKQEHHWQIVCLGSKDGDKQKLFLCSCCALVQQNLSGFRTGVRGFGAVKCGAAPCFGGDQ